MSVTNRTPFPAIAFRQYNLAGEMNGVLSVRGTFYLTDGGPLIPAAEQMPLVMSDVYDGDPHQTPQMAQTDLTPYKPGTDVTYLGMSVAPGGKALPSWTCGITVGRLEKRLRVTGPRYWRPRMKTVRTGLLRTGKEEAFDDWALSEPEPANAVPIDWRLAYGGRLIKARADAPDGVNILNPVGRGIVDAEDWQNTPEAPAPQIEDPDRPIMDVRDEPMPEGFGPISPFWRQRQQYAGTYDEVWIRERHPLLPLDFDYRFWQSAHPDIIATPWLTGDEPFALHNLVSGFPNLSGRLPGIKLKTRVEHADRITEMALVLDGVHFDMRPDVAKVFLTWRAGFRWPERLSPPVLEALDALPEGV